MKWFTITFTLSFIIAIHDRAHVQGEGGYQSSGQSSRGGHQNRDSSSPANYKFEYGVDDGAAGPQFGHEEERNGQKTRGQYRVLLPDGRMQIVTYTADENGYKADVTYENGASSSSSRPSYSTGNNNNGEGGDYGSSSSSASSYGPPPRNSDTAYSSGGGYSNSNSGGGGSFGTRNSRSFVKLRSTVDGRMFNYAY
ncbi:Pro-resilin [Orchesella cincta]|uniref:Pro-resilin n=1 Tax=Orchesella cincta TaxID=48709 RepID=A0A1D2NIV6_ORCCI|nr:Pro-resilin [Orchesella cincta]